MTHECAKTKAQINHEWKTHSWTQEYHQTEITNNKKSSTFFYHRRSDEIPDRTRRRHRITSRVLRRCKHDQTPLITVHHIHRTHTWYWHTLSTWVCEYIDSTHAENAHTERPYITRIIYKYMCNVHRRLFYNKIDAFDQAHDDATTSTSSIDHIYLIFACLHFLLSNDLRVLSHIINIFAIR